jgi:hypothetical protein
MRFEFSTAMPFGVSVDKIEFITGDTEQIHEFIVDALPHEDKSGDELFGIWIIPAGKDKWIKLDDLVSNVKDFSIVEYDRIAILRKITGKMIAQFVTTD